MVELECLRGVTIGLPVKYQALLIFAMFTMNNGFAWLMFDPVDNELQEMFDGMSDGQLELLSSWQPIMYMAAFFPIMRVMTRHDGIRRCVCLGATSEMIGAALKLVATLSASKPFALYILHIGQMFSAVASPVAIGAVSGLSAQWFEAHERTRATAAAVLSNNVGNAVCYLLVPALTSGLGYAYVTGYELLLGCIVCFLAWTKFPSARQVRNVRQEVDAINREQGITDEDGNSLAGTASSHHSDVSEDIALLPQLKALVSFPSAVLLLIIYSWSSGGYVAWTSLFDAMLGDFYSSQFVGTISFAGTVAYVVGGLLSSYLTDLYFYRHMKHVIFTCMAANTLSCLMFIASIPDKEGHILWDFGNFWILVVAALCGLFNGAAAPIFYELVAEISYPVDEGVSGNIMSMCENLGALLIYQLVARLFPAQDMNYAFTAGMAITIALSACVVQKYNRSYAALATDAADSETQTVISSSVLNENRNLMPVAMSDMKVYRSAESAS
ncbi:MFS transporter, putative [Bodo saltans]|uniref:MFS transporter, putative n=1 Tax=Bodo saltans TaxID=75058 RepID=A0A0S4J989_BODSA|nr:MFS transporter, putative [Bodo saltans]|eukprot:CUG86474.1 MFS transporter, putative [Bodo saltans]